MSLVILKTESVYTQFIRKIKLQKYLVTMKLFLHLHCVQRSNIKGNKESNIKQKGIEMKTSVITVTTNPAV